MEAGQERWAPRGEAERHSSGKKKEDHTSAPTCQWRTGPRKCHFQLPVRRKPLIQNVSRVVFDNLGILILPLLLTGLWSKATGSLSFSFSSIFTLQKVKKSQRIDHVWNLVYMRRQIPTRLLTFVCFLKVWLTLNSATVSSCGWQADWPPECLASLHIHVCLF